MTSSTLTSVRLLSCPLGACVDWQVDPSDRDAGTRESLCLRPEDYEGVVLRVYQFTDVCVYECLYAQPLGSSHRSAQAGLCASSCQMAQPRMYVRHYLDLARAFRPMHYACLGEAHVGWTDRCMEVRLQVAYDKRLAQYPVRIVLDNWASGEFESHIANIIVHDAIGYQTEFAQYDSTSTIPANLAAPEWSELDVESGIGGANKAHLVLEFWPIGKEVQIAEQRDKIEVLGLTGITGQSGL